MIAGDRVRVQTLVAVPVERAFDLFTLELDRWWRHGPAYRIGGKYPGTLHLEPRLGGRVFEQYGKAGTALHEIGSITCWERPTRFAFTWRGVNFRSDEHTTVDVAFEQRETGTRVTLEHAGFAALRPDHPVRHGKAAAEFIADLGKWWGSLVTALREYAEP